MKLIQTLEGMSMNSLKPSINSEPESSLDSCMMKEVDDCLLSNDLLSQNNGQKELCVTDFEIGSVGNTGKKMFEQVDLNSSLPGSEVTHKKDSWSPVPVYNKTSEKENMVEPSEVRFDILSDVDDDDDDDNDSIHLKISSDDENSNLDSYTNDLCSSSCKQSINCNDELSQNAIDGVEIGDASCEKEDYCLSANVISESSDELTVDNFIYNEKTESLVQCEGDSAAKSTLGTETEHEHTSEELEPATPCSDSPGLSVNDDSCNASETMVNEVKSLPTSPKSFNTKGNLKTTDTNLEINNEGSPTNSIKDRVYAQEVSQHEGSSQNLEDSNPELGDIERGKNSSHEIIQQGQKTQDQLIGNSSNSEDTTHSSPKKEIIILSDDAVNSDNKEMDETINEEATKMDKVIINDNIGKVTVSCENVEEIDCEITEGMQSSVSAKMSNSVKEVEEIDEIREDAHSPNSAETNDSLREEKLINEDNALNDSFEGSLTVKNGSSEENFLEILEYQPISEDADDLKDIQSDKEISYSEINHISSIEDENASELPVPTELNSDKTSEEGNLSSIQKDSSVNLDKNPVEIDTISVNSMKSLSNENSECEEQVSIANEIESSATKRLKRLDCSENERVSMENDSMSDSEEDKEVELQSENSNVTKTELPTEISGAKASRKRSSSYEENLVNLKRTKVAISESEANDECDVFVCEQSTENELKRIAEVDTKEKCDSRVKRLSSSVSDTNDVKKIRVLPETSQLEKKKEVLGDESTDRNFELVKDDEKNMDSKSESSKPEEVKLNSLPFLRNLSRSQLKNLTRNDLEELVLQKICEAITERSQCGELRELAQSLEQKIKAWQKKSLQLTKQVKDLNLVLKRYSSDLQSKGPNAVPVKITRSVGLQVQMPGSSNGNWYQEESSRRKGDKSSSSASSLSTPSSGTTAKNCTPSPAKPASATVPKVTEANENQGSSGPPRSSLLSVPQTVVGAKVLPPKVPTSSNPVTSNANKSSNKQQSSTANNKSKSSSNLQVIDLTDHEEKTKNNANRVSAVSSTPTTTSVPVPVATTVNSPAVSSNSVANVNAACRSIRVVQHLSNSTSILTQTGTNTVAGQRVAYFVPTTSVPVQQRQLIISSSPQIRPAGVLSMSQRQNPLPTILLKPGQVVPVSPAGASGGSIIRTTTINNQMQLATRPQPRSGQVFQRFQSPVQSTALSVVQSSGLSVSSVSHPAPLPPIPSTMANSAKLKLPPPKPDLKISKVPNRNQQGIVLSWNMTVTNEYEEIASYQLFAYQEGSAPPSTQLWKKVGDVKALPLPMACTLTQFMEGHKYHFAVRAVDIYARCGPFSEPGNIVLTRN